MDSVEVLHGFLRTPDVKTSGFRLLEEDELRVKDAEVMLKFGNRIADRSSQRPPSAFTCAWELGVCCDDE